MTITGLVITFNEAPNIRRVLSHLTWLERVIVLDSGSTDETLAICADFKNVEIVHRAFDGFASQCNHGLSLVQSEWCLSIDADYVVPPETAAEMQQAVRDPNVDGHEAELVYCIRGQRLARAILPPRTVLFRTKCGRYIQDGHAHRLQLDGNVARLEHPVLHDDRKPMKRWLSSQDTYATQEAEKLRSTPWDELAFSDRVRRLVVVAPWLVPAYYLVARQGLRDGWAGLDYAAQRAIAELVLAIKLIEREHASGMESEP
jgi:glycosyltransferase involved in cell wall biosynthesis